MQDKVIEFGPFRLENAIVYDSRNRQLELPEQAIKVLRVLLEHTLKHGPAVLSSAELRSKAWPGRVVENNNLHQQIIRLRKALGAGVLVSTSGPRSYQLTLPVRLAGGLAATRWRARSILPFVSPPGFFHAAERLRLAGYHLALGIIHHLRTLTRLELREIAPQYLQPGWQPNAVQIAREQRTGLVLTGHLTATGQAGQLDDLRVQLIEAQSASVLWSGKFSVNAADSAAIEQEIARQLVEKLGLSLPADYAQRPIRQPHPEAVACYRRGAYLFGTQYGVLNEALDEYTYALSLDPNYAEPWVGISDIWAVRCAFGPAVYAPNEGMPKALAAALRALELDPCSSHAHASRAAPLLLWEWNWDLADQHLREAIKYGPDNVFAHNWLGRLMLIRGKVDEGVRLAERAWELGPHLAYPGTLLAWVYYFADRQDEAAAFCRELLAQFPYFPVTYAIQAFICEAQGELEAAVESAQAAIARGENLVSFATLGFLYGRLGQRAEAEQVLHEFEARRQQHYVSPYHSAVVHTGLGDRAAALQFLEEAVKERSEWISHLPLDHRLRSLRNDARYQAILAQAGHVDAPQRDATLAP
ncbi:MAG: hypothetical protein HYR56_31955 [Acidobacteria bacterium]|nr:hypothetical protein [Acidobacteriota bacterium]MBI3424369.1 hypothetical protein [Acidobacteriota bacterium]